MDPRQMRQVARAIQEMRVTITEVNTAVRMVKAKDGYGSQYTLSLDLVTPVVEVPQTGDVWVIKRNISNEWRLDRKMEDAPNYPISSMNPGDKRVEASNSLFLSGQNVVISGGAVTINGIHLDDLMTLLADYGDWINFLYNTVNTSPPVSPPDPSTPIGPVDQEASTNQEKGQWYYGRNHRGPGPPYKMPGGKPSSNPPPDRDSNTGQIIQSSDQPQTNFSAVSYVFNV